jgi:hypothetical protein
MVGKGLLLWLQPQFHYSRRSIKETLALAHVCGHGEKCLSKINTELGKGRTGNVRWACTQEARRMKYERRQEESSLNSRPRFHNSLSHHKLKYGLLSEFIEINSSSRMVYIKMKGSARQASPEVLTLTHSITPNST